MGNNHTKPTFRYHNDGHVSDVHESFSRNFPNWYLDDDITVPKVFASLLDVALKNSLQHQFFWRDDKHVYSVDVVPNEEEGYAAIYTRRQ